MHTKDTGTYGELVVAADLYRRQYSVFSEIGDNSKVDLIAINGDQVLRLQVKTIALNNGVAIVSKVSSGPGYKYMYSKREIDYVAAYVYTLNTILYVPIEDFTSNTLSIRFTPAKNGQRCRTPDKYLDL